MANSFNLIQSSNKLKQVAVFAHIYALINSCMSFILKSNTGVTQLSSTIEYDSVALSLAVLGLIAQYPKSASSDLSSLHKFDQYRWLETDGCFGAPTSATQTGAMSCFNKYAQL